MVSSSWRFGDVFYDGAGGILRVAGQSIELDRTCRAILVALLQNAGHPVSKERLLRAGWPDRIVHENSLTKAVGRLRSSLGDDGRQLKTVYGRGYVLLVEVEEDASAELAAENPKKCWRQRLAEAPKLKALAFSTLAVAGIGGAVWSLQTSALDDPPIRQTAPVTGDAPDAIGKILWVDDHPENNEFEKEFFENHHISVHQATNTADALKLLSIYHYQAVISDMGRSGDRLAGLKLAEEMRERGDKTRLLIYTVRPNERSEQIAQRDLVTDAGADDLALTPIEVRSKIMKIFDYPSARRVDKPAAH